MNLFAITTICNDQFHDRKIYVKYGVFLVSVLLIASFLFLKFQTPLLYHQIIQEDALLETLQVFAYSLTSGCALLTAICFYRKNQILYGRMFLGITLALLFVVFEEMSWGQRIFYLDTPTFFERNNRQHEISIHNLAPIHDIMHYIYIVVGIFFTLCALIASANRSLREKLPWLEPLYLCMPGIYTTLYFLPLALVYSALEYFRADVGHILVWRDQEPVEFLLSLGMLQIPLVTLFRLFSKSQVADSLPIQSS